MRTMPENGLVDYMLEPLGNPLTTPSERLVLKMAAALLKQIDPDYDYAQETDDRLKLTREEMEWLPEKLEVSNGIVVANAWSIPEHMAAVEREEATIHEIMNREGLDYGAAASEYVRRLRNE